MSEPRVVFSDTVLSQFAPQDTAKLVELQGGPDKFIARLDYIFDNVSPAGVTQASCG